MILLSVLFQVALAQAPGVPQEEGTFAAARRVLEARCLDCHGGGGRESGLSFATGETFREGGDRGPVVAEAEPGKSRLLEVISYRDPSLAMPPDGRLPDEDRAVLEAWVMAGAPWPEGEVGELADPTLHPREEGGGAELGPWWAYDPLVAPPLPPGTAEHAVDRFIERRLEEAGIERASRAEPAALLRRATFRLTGLPPTAAQRHRFLRNVETVGFEAAWGVLLEELLASPQYGVAQARRWLDLVRYGETNGYERDRPKENVWRYRDWVVRAFNQDLPYPRFAALQLAGDEIAEGLEDPADRADALLATGFHRLGVWDDEPADRAQARSDERADIVDTMSQTLFATTMGCARCHDHKADPVTQREYFELTAHFRGLIGQGYDAARPVADAPGDGAISVHERDARAAALDVSLAALLAGADEPPTPAVATLVTDARPGAPSRWRYLRGGPVDGWQAPGFDDSTWDEGPGGFGTRGTPGALVGTEWTGKHLLIRTTFGLEAIPPALRLHLHHDEAARVFLNGVLVFERQGFRRDYGSFQLGPEAVAALVVGRNVLAVHCRQTAGGQYLDAGLDTGLDPDAEGAAWARAARLVAAGGQVADAAQGLIEEREMLLRTPVAEPYPAQIAYERGRRPERQHIELRGSVHALGDPVEPGLPAAWLMGADPGSAPYALPPEDAHERSSGRRAALAAWAFDGGRHVTARVEANRLFQWLFGRGLCRSAGDFGRLGERPTHPELLDALAVGLIERGWSRKRWLLWVMNSDAFLASSTGPEASHQADPRNDLLWRFDPARLSAEEFRDAALLASGELNEDIGGPWVFPPLAEEVLATSSQPDHAWGTSTPDQAVRRSLYVHVKRSLREPLLAALDQPDPDLPCPTRFLTNVPTQALLTLNGEFVRGRADRLAEDLARGGEGSGSLVARAVQRVLGRAATGDEERRGLELVDSLQGDHGLSPERALALYCLALFNRSEFLWMD